MGALPQQLIRDLRDRFGLSRAIETGTYRGGGARVLARYFPEVVTIELDAAIHAAAAGRLARVPGITAVQGSSRERLGPLVDPTRPTLYWLDGHWSGGATAGEDDECPVLDELATAAAGHPDDCILIDDARLFLESPPPPHKPEQWPTYDQIVEAVRATRPAHLVEVAHDVVVAVPTSGADIVERFAARPPERLPLGRRLVDRALGRG